MDTTNETKTANHCESVDSYNEFLDNHHEKADAEKIKAFITWGEENRNQDPMLAINVIEQFEVESFLTHASDVTNHGISGGFSGWIYYNETEAFYLANKDAIVQSMKSLHEGLGEGNSYIAMLASFPVMEKQEIGIDEIAEFIYSDNKELDGFAQFANNMAWVVAEDVCRNYVDFLEEYDDELEDELDDEFFDDGYE